MRPRSPPSSRLARFVVSAAVPAALLLMLCGCKTTGTDDITGALGEKAESKQTGDGRRDLETWRERYRADPKNADVALQYGKALRATGQRAQAVAVLEQAS